MALRKTELTQIGRNSEGKVGESTLGKKVMRLLNRLEGVDSKSRQRLKIIKHKGTGRDRKRSGEHLSGPTAEFFNVLRAYLISSYSSGFLADQRGLGLSETDLSSAGLGVERTFDQKADMSL